MQINRYLKIIVFAIFPAYLLIFCQPVSACAVDVSLDLVTVQKGYTVSNPEDSFRIGLVSNSVNQAVNVRLEALAVSSFTLPEGKRLISNIYEYNLIGQSTNPVVLQKPIWLFIVYNSDTIYEKELMSWNSDAKQWVKIEANVDKASQTIKINSYESTAQLAVFELDIEPLSPMTAKIDLATVKKGYTVNNQDQTLALGVLPDSFDQEFRVDLSEIELPASLPENRRLISRVYQFDIRTDKTIDFAKPIWLKIHYYITTDLLKQIYYYDEGKKEWVHLPSSADIDNQVVKAAFHLKYAKVAVLSDDRFLSEGVASWYRDSRYPYGAANNDYPLETSLRVTNLATGSTVIIKKYSNGPYVAGRVIDLVLTAFCEIGKRSEGVIRVKVEPVSPIL